MSVMSREPFDFTDVTSFLVVLMAILCLVSICALCIVVVSFLIGSQISRVISSLSKTTRRLEVGLRQQLQPDSDMPHFTGTFDCSARDYMRELNNMAWIWFNDPSALVKGEVNAPANRQGMVNELQYGTLDGIDEDLFGNGTAQQVNEGEHPAGGGDLYDFV